MEAVASRLEAIASRLEAVDGRLQAIASRLEAIAISLEVSWRCDVRGLHPSHRRQRLSCLHSKRHGALRQRRPRAAAWGPGPGADEVLLVHTTGVMGGHGFRQTGQQKPHILDIFGYCLFLAGSYKSLWSLLTSCVV